MNNKIILFPSLKQHPAVKVNKVPATVRALALALRVKLNISPDASLVYILGYAEAKSNQSAIEKWLLDNFGESDIKTLHSPLEDISNSLEIYLNDKLMMEDESC